MGNIAGNRAIPAGRAGKLVTEKWAEAGVGQGDGPHGPISTNKDNLTGRSDGIDPDIVFPGMDVLSDAGDDTAECAGRRRAYEHGILEGNGGAFQKPVCSGQAARVGNVIGHDPRPADGFAHDKPPSQNQKASR